MLASFVDCGGVVLALRIAVFDSGFGSDRQRFDACLAMQREQLEQALARVVRRSGAGPNRCIAPNDDQLIGEAQYAQKQRLHPGLEKTMRHGPALAGGFKQRICACMELNRRLRCIGGSKPAGRERFDQRAGQLDSERQSLKRMWVPVALGDPGAHGLRRERCQGLSVHHAGSAQWQPALAFESQEACLDQTLGIGAEAAVRRSVAQIGEHPLDD